MSTIYNYTAPVESCNQSPFWRVLNETVKRDSSDTLIIVPNEGYKMPLYRYFGTEIPELRHLPEIVTLDNVLQNSTAIVLESGELTLKLIIKDVLESIRDTHPLHPISHTPGLQKQLYRFIQDYRTYNNDLRPLIAHADSKKMAIAITDIVELIFKRYLRIHPHDKWNTYRHLSPEQIQNCQNILSGKSIFFINPYPLIDSQIPFFNNVLKIAKSASILTPFSPLSDIRIASPSLESITEPVNRVKTIAMNPTDQPAPTIHSIYPTDITNELNTIAMDIVTELRNNPDLALSDITVVIPSTHPYQNVLPQVFSQFKLPHTLRHTPSLSSHPLGHWCMTYLEAAISNANAKTMLDLIKNPLSPHLLASTSYPNMTFCAHLVASHGIRKGFNDWQKALDSEIYFSSLNANAFPDYKATIAIHKQWFEDFQERTKNISNTASPDSITQHLISILNDVPENSPLNDPTFEEAKSALILALYTFRDVLSSQEIANDPIKNLGLCLENTPLRSADPLPDSIEVITKSSTSILPKKRCYVLGLTTTLWGSPIKPLFFCTNHHRIALGWPSNQELLQTDKWRLASLISSSDTIILSIPNKIDNSITNPAHIVSDILEYFDWELTPYTLSDNQKTEKSYLIDLGNELQKNHQRPIPASTQLQWPRLAKMLQETPDTGPTIPSIAQKRFDTHSFSATELERYQHCPYHFYHHAILNEQPLDDISDDVSAATWGSLIHLILEGFHNELRQKGIPIKSLTLPDATAHIHRIAEHHLNRMKKNTYFWAIKERILFGTAKKKGLLAAYVQFIIDHPLQLEPVQFEVPFDNIDICSTRLNGKIDSILEHPQHTDIAIMDFKTGKDIPKPSEIGSHYSLQLPIYLLAARHIHPQKTPIAGLILQLRAPNLIERYVITCTKESKKDIFDLGKKRPFELTDAFYDSLSSHIGILKKLILAGEFTYDKLPPLEANFKKRQQTCTYCPYWHSCRFPERFKR